MSLLQSETLSIGEVVARLRPVYDVSESNLRFWEKQGLLHPQRTPGGHRVYAAEDVERIKLIKSLQEQRRLPLSAIRHLCEIPVDKADDLAVLITSMMQPLHFEPGYHPRDRAALAAETALDVALIDELTTKGLLRPTAGAEGDSLRYDEDDRAFCRMVAELLAYGLPLALVEQRAAMVRRHVRAEWEEIIQPNLPMWQAMPVDKRLRMKQVGEEMEVLLFSMARRQMRDELWQQAEAGQLPCQNEDR